MEGAGCAAPPFLCKLLTHIQDRKEGGRTEDKIRAEGGPPPQPISSRRLRSGSHASAVLRLLPPGTGNRGPILAQGALYPFRAIRNSFCRRGCENREYRQNQNRTNQRVDYRFLFHIQSSHSNLSFLKGRRPGREQGFPIREDSSEAERGTYGW